jgi:hypothetical protein
MIDALPLMMPTALHVEAVAQDTLRIDDVPKGGD